MAALAGICFGFATLVALWLGLGKGTWESLGGTMISLPLIGISLLLLLLDGSKKRANACPHRVKK
jgi:hypothetical protein